MQDQLERMDAVLARMDDRLDVLRADQDKRRFFLTVYRTMTRATADAVRAGRFMDPAWTAELTARFSTLYFDADAAWCDQRPCPTAWTTAFDVTCRRRVNPVEHALLGINAHIVYDLPVAVAATMQASGDAVDGEIVGGVLARRRHDYEVVNHVLADTVDAAQDLIAEMAGPTALIDLAMLRFDEYLAELMLRAARTQGWHTAVALAVARDEAERSAVLQHLDRVSCEYVERIDVLRMLPTRAGQAFARRIRPPFLPTS